MKKLYVLSFLLLNFIVNAQIVNIPDANFKAALLSAGSNNNIASTATPHANGGVGTFNAIDTNGDGNIQVSEAEAIKYLSIVSLAISDLTGIEAFTNLVELRCNNNSLTGLDVSNLTNLYTLNCGNNQLTSLNLSNCTNLYWLFCNYNQLISLDASDCINLHLLQCRYNQLSSLDISGCTILKELSCHDNQLTNLDVSNSNSLTSFDCQNNQLTSLNVSNFVGLTSFDCQNNQLTSLNVSGCTNLEVLYCDNNQLTSLDVSGLTSLNSLEYTNGQLISLDASNCASLNYLICNNNQLINLDVTGCIHLAQLYCNNNQLTSLYVSNLTFLNWLSCYNNELTSLNISGCNNLLELDCRNNQLIALFIKTGSSDLNLSLLNNPNIQYICADEENVEMYQQEVIDLGYINCHVNSYCSFTPGGTFYEVSGNTKYDFDTNGCDVSDINYPNLNFNITDGTTTDSFISNVSGNFDIPLQAGNYIITPNLENPTYFNITPPSFTVDFPTQPSPFTQDFCVTANGVHSDVEVMIVPRNPARPGFDANYKIVFRNKGNQLENGNVTLAFDDAVLDYVSSNPVYDSVVTNSLIWNYTNLQPFETREIEITFNVNSPTETPAVNNGDVLNYTATITTANTDETIEDNSFTLNQTVVGSYDPNDKTCLEGEVVEPNMIGKYVHYVIRFENTGTYPAQNIVVKDMIDASKFDLSSLVPLHSSHDFYTRIKDNKVEFIFENINLDFNDAINDGYVAFKIKTLPTLTVGETFSNEANIYFDYNFPITTNNYVTTIQALSNPSFEFEKEFVLYPNPVKDILNISGKNQAEIKSVEIYNIIGQLVIAVSNSTGKIDISNLENGTYFIKVNSEKGSGNTKFIKE
ncbi:DUF7619 domain-containing protein [Flavobacterium sp. U410]